MVKGQLLHIILSFSAPPNLQPFFPNRSLNIGAPGKAGSPSLSKKVPSQHIPVACATMPVSSPSQEESGPQSGSAGRGPGSLLYLRSQNRRTAFQGKQDGEEHQHVQVLELAFSYFLGITAPGEQASVWIMHNCCRGEDLIHVLTFLMGSFSADSSGKAES